MENNNLNPNAANPNPIPNDKPQIPVVKKKMKTSTKILIGIGSTLLIGGGIYLIVKGHADAVANVAEKAIEAAV